MSVGFASSQVKRKRVEKRRVGGPSRRPGAKRPTIGRRTGPGETQ